MDKFSEPFILTDKNRLNEILRLRHDSFKDHECLSNFDRVFLADINNQSDGLDENGIHFIITNNENDEIAATYRINIIETIDQLPYPGIFKPFNLPRQTPFVFYSRLAVCKKYQHNNLANKLQKELCSFHKKNNISFGIGTVTHLLGWLQKWGFEILGDVNPKLDKNYHYGNSIAVIVHRDNIKFHDKTTD